MKHTAKFFLAVFPVFFLFSTSFMLVVFSTILYSDGDGLFSTLKRVNPYIYSLFSSRPKVLGISSQTIKTGDYRVFTIKQFFSLHNAPLSQYAEKIVFEADKNKIDWRLLPAIGMCESNGGKKIPQNSFNAWGWAASEEALEKKSGEYNNDSWERGIERVSKGLAKGYYHLIDPTDGIDFEDIWNMMEKYTPPSVAKGGPWAKCVWQYYKELSNFQTPL